MGRNGVAHLHEKHPETHERYMGHPVASRYLSQNSFRNGISDSDSNRPILGVKEPGYQNGESSFDTGLIAWLQVLGSFFLFFNSWYVGMTLTPSPLVLISQ
jgi:hypothetical protein